jgi:hypothetical protein
MVAKMKENIQQVRRTGTARLPRTVLPESRATPPQKTCVGGEIMTHDYYIRYWEKRLERKVRAPGVAYWRYCCHSTGMCYLFFHRSAAEAA